MTSKKDIVASMADQFVASRMSRIELLSAIARSGADFVAEQPKPGHFDYDVVCENFSADIANKMSEVARHDHYMACIKRQMSVTLNNDMGEVNSYLAAAQRRRDK